MFTRILLSSAMCAGFFTMTSTPAHAGPDPFIGEIMLSGYNFCPRGWAKANGQLLPISQYSALFALYGTTYGGDGRTSFGLPDLRGRTPIHVGHGPGLEVIKLGEKGGTEKITPKSSGLTGVKSNEGPKVASSELASNNRSPYLGIQYCVAVTGIFPSRS